MCHPAGIRGESARLPRHRTDDGGAHLGVDGIPVRVREQTRLASLHHVPLHFSGFLRPPALDRGAVHRHAGKVATGGQCIFCRLQTLNSKQCIIGRAISRPARYRCAEDRVLNRKAGKCVFRGICRRRPPQRGNSASSRGQGRDRHCTTCMETMPRVLTAGLHLETSVWLTYSWLGLPHPQRCPSELCPPRSTEGERQSLVVPSWFPPSVSSGRCREKQPQHVAAIPGGYLSQWSPPLDIRIQSITVDSIQQPH